MKVLPFRKRNAPPATPRPRVYNLGAWLMPATFDNVDELLHRLWSQAARGDYRKDEWGALHSMITRLRYPGGSETG